MSHHTSDAANGPSAGPLPSRPAVPSGDRPAGTPGEGLRQCTGLRQSARWAAIGQAARVGGQVISLVVLSRLLPPSAYGLMAMAGIVIALASMLREMGTGSAIVQRQTLNDRFTSTLFWATLGVGLLLALALCAASGVLARFFGEAELQPVLIALAGLFPLTSLTTVHQAMVERRSDFRSLAWMDIAGLVLGLTAAIGSALAGAGVYALVIQLAVNAVVSNVWLWRASGWRPQWVLDGAELRALWHFGGTLTAFNFINYFARNADSLVIGRLLGAAPLGAYGMAYKLMLFPVQNMGWIANRVLLPRLSRLQSDVAESRRVYMRSLATIATLSAPLMALLWVAREPFVQAVLGHRWDTVTPVLAWLAPVGFLQSMVSTTGTVFTAAGNVRRLLGVGVFNTTLYLIGFVAGVPGGITGVAAGYCVANLITTVTTGWLVGRQLQARPGELWQALRAPLLSTAGAMLAAWLVGRAVTVDGWPAMAQLVATCTVGAGVYAALMTQVFRGGLTDLVGLLRGQAA